MYQNQISIQDDLKMLESTGISLIELIGSMSIKNQLLNIISTRA